MAPTPHISNDEPKNYWYDAPDVEEKVQALDNTKRDWNFSPLRTDFAITSGRLLNVAFIATTLLTAPSTIAASPIMLIACAALATTMQRRKMVKRGKAIDASVEAGSQAPRAVETLAQKTYLRAGLPTDNIKISVLEPNPAINDFMTSQLPYTVAIISEQNHILIGRTALEKLDQNELQSILAHESSHYINQHTGSCAHSLAENAASSTLLLMGASSLLSLNFLAAGYYTAAGTASIIGRAYLKKLDEYRADRNAVPISDEPQALSTGLHKLEDALLSRTVKDGDPSKIRTFKRIESALSAFAHHPRIENRKRYIAKIESIAAQTIKPA